MEHRYLTHALANAFKSTMDKKHGAVIVANHKIIAGGYNTLQHNWKESYRHKCLCSNHAEITALNNIKYQENKRKFSKMSLYVVRIDKDGKMCISKPCKYCVYTMRSYRIKKVCYSTDDSYRTVKVSDLLNEDFFVTSSGRVFRFVNDDIFLYAITHHKKSVK